jgi:hypothetical protein
MYICQAGKLFIPDVNGPIDLTKKPGLGTHAREMGARKRTEKASSICSRDRRK